MFKKNRLNQNYLKNLRARAEKKLSPVDIEDGHLTSVDVNRLVHELRVNQIELEMQNEELVNKTKALELKSERYIDLYDFAPTGYLTLDETGRISEANLTIASMLGMERQKLVGKALTQFMDSEDADHFYLLSKELFTNGVAVSESIKLVKTDGNPIYVNLYCMLVRENGKSFFRMVASDISRQREAEEKLQLTAKVLENTMEGVIITDAKANIIMVNPAFTAITGYSLDEVLGKNPNLLQSGRHDADFFSRMWQSLTTSGHWEGEIWNRRRNGEIFPQWMNINTIKNDRKEIVQFVGIFHDITVAKGNETRIHHLATHDVLTNLPNRGLLWDRLDLMINQAHREKKQIAVLFLDIDHFKAINDTYGHQVGDQVLVIFGERLTSCLRESDTLARMGGDEFVILLGDISHRQSIGKIAQKFMDTMGTPIYIHDLKFNITFSMGISLYPGDGLNGEMLLKNADRALYHAKEQGRNRFCFFTENMDAEEKMHLALGNNLREALNRDEFRLQYQPLVDLHSGQIVGVEALLRWQHPQMGVVPPATIIPLAEETGLIGAISNWVLHTACEQNSTWQPFCQAKAPVKISINISPYQFQRGDLVNNITQIVNHYGLRPELLDLDLTEDMLIKDPENSARTLTNLINLGVGLTIDDFGTGCSSLGFLIRYPVQAIKIDRFLVSNMTQNGNMAATVIAFINFAHSLGIKTVAKGVETERQAHILWAEGCDRIQGYFFSRPVEAKDMTTMLQEDRHLVISKNWLSNS